MTHSFLSPCISLAITQPAHPFGCCRGTRRFIAITVRMRVLHRYGRGLSPTRGRQRVRQAGGSSTSPVLRTPDKQQSAVSSRQAIWFYCAMTHGTSDSSLSSSSRLEFLPTLRPKRLKRVQGVQPAAAAASERGKVCPVWVPIL